MSEFYDPIEFQDDYLRAKELWSRLHSDPSRFDRLCIAVCEAQAEGRPFTPEEQKEYTVEEAMITYQFLSALWTRHSEHLASLRERYGERWYEKVSIV